MKDEFYFLLSFLLYQASSKVTNQKKTHI